VGALALGIDIGMSGVRAAVLDQQGNLQGAARRPLVPRFPAPGLAEQDPAAWIDAVLAAGREAVRAVSAAGGRVAAVGVGALGPAPALYDDSLQPLTPAYLFALDRRAEAERERLGVSQDHALPKLLWWADREPDLVQRAAWALDATGYVVAALTGVPTMDTVTARDYVLEGHTAPVAIPEAVDPLAVAGELAPEPARALGLPAGLPVAAGTYDTYVDVAGVGVRRPGDGCILLGSTLAVCRAVPEPVDCPDLDLSAYPGEGLLLGGYTASAGSALRWFERELGNGELGELLVRAAELEPGAGGLLGLPYLAGERTPVRDPRARGALIGLTLNTSREEAYRALVDAVALSTRDLTERLRALGLAPGRWLTGGGGTRHAAWLRATADAVGAPLAVVAFAGEAIGPADLALRAIGVDTSPRIASEIEPDPRRRGRFEALHSLYRDLHSQLAQTMHALSDMDAAR
jgi:xylulokinase